MQRELLDINSQRNRTQSDNSELSHKLEELENQFNQLNKAKQIVTKELEEAKVWICIKLSLANILFWCIIFYCALFYLCIKIYNYYLLTVIFGNPTFIYILIKTLNDKYFTSFIKFTRTDSCSMLFIPSEEWGTMFWQPK